MKLSSKSSFFAFLFIFLGVSFASAQNCEPQSGTSDRKKDDKSLTVEYDSSVDETIVQTAPMVIARSDYSFKAEKIVIKAGFVFQGKQLSAAPKTILLEVFASSRDGLFADEESRALSIKTDDKLLVFGVFRLFSARTTAFINQMNKSKAEHLGIEIPRAAFTKMIASQKVVFELGEQKIKLKEANLKTFCKILSYAEAVK